MGGKGREGQSIWEENALPWLLKCMENISVHTISHQLCSQCLVAVETKQANF